MPVFFEQAAACVHRCYSKGTSRTDMGLSWFKVPAALLLSGALLGAGFPQPDAQRMLGTWVLTDQATSKRHPGPQSNVLCAALEARSADQRTRQC